MQNAYSFLEPLVCKIEAVNGSELPTIVLRDRSNMHGWQLWHADPVSNSLASLGEEVPVFRAYKHTLLLIFLHGRYTLKWYQSWVCWTAPTLNWMSYKNRWSLVQCKNVNLFAVINKLPFYIDNQISHFNSNKGAFCSLKTCKLHLQPHTPRPCCRNELNARICVILKSGKMINSESQTPTHTQLKQVWFGRTSQGSIFLWDNRLLDEHISATPKSSFPSHQACQRFHCKTKVTSGIEIWQQILGFLGYKMK